MDDTELIERGEYLVYGPAACATCHIPMDRVHDMETGEKVPLMGGFELDIPPASLRAPNLTPDPQTGIGNLTDGEIARTLRHNVGHDGRVILPVMDYQELSDEDLKAVISFLRSQEPVRNEIEPSQFTFLGKALLAFGLINPMDRAITPPATVEREPTAEYGSYLVRGVAHCMGCHTELNPATGEPTGEYLAGGFYFEPTTLTEGYSFISPNLTPDSETGIIANWTEDQFIHRFQTGRVRDFFSPMPWGSFSRMDSTELAAIYTYLQSLDPVYNEIEQTVFPPEE